MRLPQWLRLLFRRGAYLNHDEIIELVNSGAVSPWIPECVNTASLDVRLGNYIMVEEWAPSTSILEFGKREAPSMREVELDPVHGYVLKPGEFILAHTVEWFEMPDDLAALFRSKSSMGRTGLEHMDAGWVDPGFYGRLTLELTNCLKWHSIRLRPGDRIGQLVFLPGKRVKPQDSYRTTGNYNDKSRAFSISFKD